MSQGYGQNCFCQKKSEVLKKKIKKVILRYCVTIKEGGNKEKIKIFVYLVFSV